MPNVSGRTLVAVIQVLDDKIASMSAQIADGDPDDAALADVEEEMVGYTIAAMELKKAYAEALSEASNLPPYSELVRG
jgi:hypothetical protein